MYHEYLILKDIKMRHPFRDINDIVICNEIISVTESQYSEIDIENREYARVCVNQ